MGQTEVVKTWNLVCSHISGGIPNGVQGFSQVCMKCNVIQRGDLFLFMVEMMIKYDTIANSQIEVISHI